ncbi:EF-hand domain-containing protein [Sedimentitalea sp. HM32M-2]|uniref:EF-hand domain-containing protein n=1 Tax=Sedimentitalea sp. HM32M-2 TaxID=3351566 RepID=UPI003643B2AE
MSPRWIGAALLALGLAGPAIAQQGQPGAHFIENWDQDGDRQVTLQEATQKRAELFTMFDQDENGLLDTTEYQLFDMTRQADMAENAGGHGKGPMKSVNQGLTLPFNDVNGDGAVSRDEFRDRTADWMAGFDRDRDGVISTTDFGGRLK